ncbi:FUSC domain protein, putative [Rhizoctonia solani AG-3 Rhs1AP]|uniref:FUSC domain protein, putative n=1 Tax=Rhizoctonia solani AG-3 Rhs1AP TaxID=1086054 RepID=A0A0A1ULR3_9AGAM|nr:FUSC domain protein, putative [Rhizoctonia solani AG-3 Rhs1AP]
MIPPHRSKDGPESRARALSRILDPEYTGQSASMTKSFRARSPSLPRASVFVDRYGEQHDPDFRPFGSHPAVTPMEEPRAWPWYDDDEDDEPRSTGHGPTNSPRGHMSYSTTSSSYHSSIISSASGSTSGSAYGIRSRSASALLTPPPEPEKLMAESHNGRKLSPPAHIPRSALFPWTPAQRAVRLQHEVHKRHVIPPPFLEEEPEEVPLTLVDSRYVPGYGHFIGPSARPSTAPESEHKDGKCKFIGRARAHTAPSPTTSQPPEEDQEPEPDPPASPSSHHSFRQSVYSFGLRTKLGLHHMKYRIRRASGAAKRPLSL